MNSTPAPPRFVPTLTEVVHPASVPDSIQTRTPTANALLNADTPLRQFEDQMLHRVMQRVDLVLEHRLHEAVSKIVLTHIQTLEPRLREEIERVVRESVSQAVAQELPLLAVSD
ncbi:MAG: hypothetical protein EAZ34_09140 [Polaromonas sp.]|nr:MAG: hypothetical protein EAZ34_09140 [Polaromonas sp.]